MGIDRPKTIAIVLSLITTLLITIQYSVPVRSDFVEPRDRVFGYVIDLSALGIRPKYVKAIDSTRIAVVGGIGNVNGIAILNISNPYKPPVLEDLYPLVGSPTAIAVDGFPVTRIAVGSNKGEILVLRIDRGAITKHLYRVLGADFYIDKIYLARDVVGGTKIVTLVVEGGARGYPCMNCYIYILDERGADIIRVGHGLGNVTKTCRGLEHVRVQDVAPLTVYGDRGYYWDASKVFIAYMPRSISLTFNVTYYNPGRGAYDPLPNTLVEVVLIGYDVRPIVYGVNADDQGVVRVPIPYWGRSYTVNLTIRDSRFNVIWSYRYLYDPAELRTRFGDIPDEVPLPSARLPTSDVDSRPAIKVYGVPPFLQVLLDLVDISSDYLNCVRVGTAGFSLSPNFRGLTFFAGSFETRYKVAYTYPDAGKLHIATIDIDVGRGIRRVGLAEDYVGLNVEVVSSITYHHGTYTVIGLSDGRIRVYAPEGTGYRLIHIYTMCSELYNLIAVPAIEGYVYTAISSQGIQVFRIEPYVLPVFRGLTDLHLTVRGYVHGDALANLKMAVVVNSTHAVMVKNADIAVRQATPYPMSRFMARDIVLNIVMPGGEAVNGTIVVFRYPNGYITHQLARESITLKNIILGVEYTLDIYAPRPHIYNGSITFRLRDDGMIEVLRSSNVSVESLIECCRLTIGMKYREYTVRLVVFDEVTGPKLIAPIDIYVDGVLINKEPTYEHRHAFKVLYGEHNITITPSKGFEEVYQATTLIKFIDKDVELELTIRRVRYSVLVGVVDELTRGKPIAPVTVTIAGTTYTISPETPTVNLSLPYGSYTLSFRPAKGFENVYLAKEVLLDVPKTTTLTVPMTRVTYIVRLEVKDPYTYRLIAPIDIALNNTVIKAGVKENEHVLRIPYGVWLLRVAPTEEYVAVYEVVEKEVLVDGNVYIELVIDRVRYPVTISLVDIYRVIVSPVDVMLEGPITLVRSVQPPGAPISLYLPYGEYRLMIRPFNASIYMPYQTVIVVDAPKNIAIPIQRVSYKVEIKVVDTLIGVVRGLFALYANETKILENVGPSVTIDMPYGVYVFRLVPMSGFERTYNPSPPVTAAVVGNTTVNIPVVRKTYRLRFAVMEGATPVANAIIYVYSLERYELYAQTVTDPNGVAEVEVPYGEYRILVKHGMYVEQEIPMRIVDRDTVEFFDLRPTITTLVWRYAPIAGVLIGVGVAIYAIMRIRAAIAKRLVTEELF